MTTTANYATRSVTIDVEVVSKSIGETKAFGDETPAGSSDSPSPNPESASVASLLAIFGWYLQARLYVDPQLAGPPPSNQREQMP
jgi:hypothetical protein